MRENTDEVIKKLLQEKLDFKLYDGDIDRSHMLILRYNNAKFQERTYPKSIIIKFTSHNVKHDVYYIKKKLKNSQYLITESLTATRLACIRKLKKMKDNQKIAFYWSYNGDIFYLKADFMEKIRITNLRAFLQ